jgi:hypothetical protein
MRLRIALLAAVASLSVPSAAAHAQNVARLPEDTREYLSAGRIKWRLPDAPDLRFSFAVPHFTHGPRLRCQFRSGGECEISVFARDLTKGLAQRRAELIQEMEKNLPRATETAVELRSHAGDGPAIHYITLTPREPGTAASVTQGFYVNGSVALRFEHHSGPDVKAELQRIFEVVVAAEPLDALAFLAWKLSDYKSVCEENFAQLRAGNDATLSGSPFASVDWLALMQRRDPARSREDFAEMFGRSKRELAAGLSRDRESFQQFCEFFPLMVLEAERHMPGGRRRGAIGVVVEEKTLVKAVLPNSPAAKAGVHAGDVIRRLDEHEVLSLIDIVRRLAPMAGARISLEIERGAQRERLVLTVAETEED